MFLIPFTVINIFFNYLCFVENSYKLFQTKEIPIRAQIIPHLPCMILTLCSLFLFVKYLIENMI